MTRRPVGFGNIKGEAGILGRGRNGALGNAASPGHRFADSAHAAPQTRRRGYSRPLCIAGTTQRGSGVPASAPGTGLSANSAPALLPIAATVLRLTSAGDGSAPIFGTSARPGSQRARTQPDAPKRVCLANGRRQSNIGIAG
jgi:hypothetical protein